MSDDNPLDEQDLDSIEHQLQRVTLSPTARQREQLLYACGVAAGRAQMKRRLTAVAAFSVVLLGVAAGLGVALVSRGGLDQDSQNVALSPSPKERVESHPDQALVPPRGDADADADNRRGQELTASSNFNEMLLADRGAAAEVLPSDRTLNASKPILTSAGRAMFDEL